MLNVHHPFVDVLYQFRTTTISESIQISDSLVLEVSVTQVLEVNVDLLSQSTSLRVGLLDAFSTDSIATRFVRF